VFLLHLTTIILLSRHDNSMQSAKLALVVSLIAHAAAAGSCTDSCKSDSRALPKSLLQVNKTYHKNAGETHRIETIAQAAKLISTKALATLNYVADRISTVEPGYISVPIWALVSLLVSLFVVSFYGINYIFWNRRKRAHRMHNLDASKDSKHIHASLLGSLIEGAIEHFDNELVGVNVDFGFLNVKAAEGVVEIADFTMENPDEYWSDYFIHVGHCVVDIDMAAYALSLGKNVVVQRLELNDVEVVWERGFFTSNFNDIMDFFHHHKAKTQKSPEQTSGSSSHAPGTSGRSTKVMEVAMNKISLKIAFHKLAGCGPRIVANDIYYEDFSQEMSSGSSTDVLPLLTRTLVESLLVNLIGQEAAHSIVEGSSSMLRSIVGSFWHLIMGIWLCIRSAVGIRAASPEDDKANDRAAKCSRHAADSIPLRQQLADALKKTSCCSQDQPADRLLRQQQPATCLPMTCSLM